MTPKPLTPHPLQLSALLRGATELWVPMKEQPERRGEVHSEPAWYWQCKSLEAGYCHTNQSAMERLMSACAPYQPGEVVAVKEAWSLGTGDGKKCGVNVQYESDPWLIEVAPEHDAKAIALGDRIGWGKKRSARSMPPWAVRLYLKFTATEARQVQSVTEEEAQKAGVTCGMANADFSPYDYRAHFASFMNSIHGPDCWERNCWCWKFTVERKGA